MFRFAMLGFVMSFVGGSVLGQAPKKLTYADHVLPILQDKCLNCHDADKAKGGLDASSYGKLIEGGSSGAVVKPADGEGSRLYRLTAHAEEPKMPPGGASIGKANVDLIKAWIDGGALENAGSKAVVIEKKADVGLKVSARARPATPPLPAVPLPQDAPVRSARANPVTALATSPWAPLAAVAAPKAILLYHTDHLDLVGVLPFAHGQVNLLRFSRSGELLLAAGGRGGKSGKAVLYEVKTGKVVAELGDENEAILAADLSPDQSMIAVGGPGRTVRVYATDDGHKIREIKKHTDWVTALEFSPDGVLLATGDRNGGLFVWEANTGRDYFPLPGHKGAITDLSWRDDGNVLASASEDGGVKLWEMEDGKNTKTIAAHPGGALGVKYSHDGSLATTGRDAKAKWFDPAGNPKHDLAGLPDMGLKAAVSHDGGRALVGDFTGWVRVWSTGNGALAGVLATNPAPFADRLELARSQVVIQATAVEKAKAAVVAAQAAAAKAEAEHRVAIQAAGGASEAASRAGAKVTLLKSAHELAQAEAKRDPRFVGPETVEEQAARAAANAKVKVTAAALAAAQAAVPQAVARVKPLQDAVPVKAKAAAEAGAALVRANAAVQQANAAHAAAKAAEERLRAVAVK